MNKVVMITGSASGLGKALTRRFIAEGYRVLATDINYEGLRVVAREEGWTGDKVWLRKLDITKPAQWQKLWQALLEKWQAVDMLLNVAAYLKPGKIMRVEHEEIERHMQINVCGLMHGARLAAQTMAEQGRGHIINIASLAGVAPIPGIALYSSSKFAVRGFSLALAQELKPRGVAVTVICPDAIETPMLDLQEDYEDAALTFSGGRTLTVDELVAHVFEKVLPQRPVEVLIPGGRGWLAKLGGAFPGVAFMLSDYLGKKGAEKQAMRRRQRHAHSRAETLDEAK